MKSTNEQQHENKDPKSRIVTIPNLLSTFRICLVPVIIWLYYVKHENLWTAGVWLLSGVTDVADGFIARHFNMSSNLGKVLDPIADKLTQTAMLLCLVLSYPLMLAPLALLVIKEIFVGYTGLMVIQKTGHVYGARWHGKLATVLLYAMMLTHILWTEIPTVVSNLSIAACVAMMLVSFVLYVTRNMKAVRENRTNF